jgi:SAM-dependent methyltransferase
MVEYLESTSYYKEFETSLYNLRLMHESLSQRLEVPDDIKESLASLPTVTFLVFGSATPRNIDNVALLDSTLRPSRVHQDSVLMIDYNDSPMKDHRNHWIDIEPTARGEEQQKYLPYPDFAFARADMRRLPIEDEMIDVVISDYTLNFLDDYDDVRRTFGEAARVLKTRGIMLLAVAGHVQVAPDADTENLAVRNAQRRERRGGFRTFQFPLQMYEQAASENGLHLRAQEIIGSDIVCAVLQKQSHGTY